MTEQPSAVTAPSTHAPVPHVAVIMVGFRNADDVEQAVGCLQRMNYRNLSVHICENGGREAFVAMARALGMANTGDGETDISIMLEGLHGPFEATLHLAPDNLGYAGGVNFCLARLSRWDAIWILNPDTQADPDSLRALVDHRASGDYGVVGSRLVNPTTNQVQLYGGRWRRWMARGLNIGLGADPAIMPDVAQVEREMDYVNGASMLVSRPFIETVGLMKEDYFLYCEEIDWCLARGRYRLGYAHASLVHHAHGSTIGSSKNRRMRSRLSVYLDERNKLLLTRRRFALIYPFVLITTLLLTTQYLRYGAVRNFGYALAGWWAGLRGETGKPLWMRSPT